MGSLRNLLKSTLPSLASLWPDTGGGSGDVERPDADANLYSGGQTRDSTHELMRECPEIIEEVVEMRYSTGTIVKPHLRHGRPSTQVLFDIAVDASGGTKEAGSDSGVSSKNSEAGDLYAVPKKRSRAAPQPPLGMTSTGFYENPLLALERPSSVYDNPLITTDGLPGTHKDPRVTSEGFYLNTTKLGMKSAPDLEMDRQATKRNHTEIAGIGSTWKRSKKKPMPFPKPESLRAKSASKLVRKSSSLRASLRGVQKAIAFMTPGSGDAAQDHARSLHNVQQCFADARVPKPKKKTKKSFRLHPKPRSEMTPEELATAAASPPLQQSINDNFTLMPSAHFPAHQASFKPPIGDQRDILNDSIEAGSNPNLTDDDDDDDIENDELEIDAAIDEALDAESMGGTLDRSAKGHVTDGRASALPLEPLYVNRHDLQQGLIEDLQQHHGELECADAASSRPASAANSDLFRAIPIEITSMDTLPKSRRPAAPPEDESDRADDFEEVGDAESTGDAQSAGDAEGAGDAADAGVDEGTDEVENADEVEDADEVESDGTVEMDCFANEVDDAADEVDGTADEMDGTAYEVDDTVDKADGAAEAYLDPYIVISASLTATAASQEAAVAPAAGDATAPANPLDTYITLNLKENRSARAGAQPPSAYRRAKMRKASSMSDLLPTVLRGGRRRPAPALPATTSLETATRRQAAHRRLRDHTLQRQARPSSAAPSGCPSAWLTLAAACAALRGWVGAVGGVVGRALGRATAPLVDWVGIKYMGVHRNHPWLPDLVSQPDLDYWVRRTKKGSNGFEELRRYIKNGGDFCKELASILQERSDLEVSYAKSLQKLSNKLLKASKEGLGSVNQAWQMVGAEMEYEADVHKTMAVAYTEELVKPLKGLVDTQQKVRKSVEGMVDKTAKNLAEWRSAEAKAKKMSYQCARENEKAEEQALNVRLGRGKQLTDKETNKVEARRQKTGEAMNRADSDYYTFCLRGERARLEWETAVNKGSECLQAVEEERLVQLRSALHTYHQHMRSFGPKLIQSASRLSEPIARTDVSRDVQTVISAKGSGHNIPEQLLPDFYAEDMTNVMNRERRKKALEQFLKLIREGVERERRGKHGVENLAKAIQATPHFGTEGSQKDVHEKLQHMRALLAYLEASRYKLQVTLSELEGLPQPQHPLKKHIEYHKDRQGMTQSILKVPAWVALDPLDDASPTNSPKWAADRGKADGISHQPDSDFDEFSSQGDDREYQTAAAVQCVSAAPAGGDGAQQTASPSPLHGDAVPSIGRCRVLYDYAANMYDELSIRTGDVINVHDKQEDGWWLGELSGIVGIFPATYVQELT